MTKVTQEKKFVVFMDFQQTTKVFPTNFLKQNCESFPYIMIKRNKSTKLFSHVTFVIYGNNNVIQQLLKESTVNPTQDKISYNQ